MAQDLEGLRSLVEDALAKAFAEVGGGFVSGYHLIVDYSDNEGERRWTYCTAEDQTQTTTLGLLTWALEAAKYETRRYFENGADDA